MRFGPSERPDSTTTTTSTRTSGARESRRTLFRPFPHRHGHPRETGSSRWSLPDRTTRRPRTRAVTLPPQPQALLPEPAPTPVLQSLPPWFWYRRIPRHGGSARPPHRTVLFTTCAQRRSGSALPPPQACRLARASTASPHPPRTHTPTFLAAQQPASTRSPRPRTCPDATAYPPRLVRLGRIR